MLMITTSNNNDNVKKKKSLAILNVKFAVNIFNHFLYIELLMNNQYKFFFFNKKNIIEKNFILI